ANPRLPTMLRDAWLATPGSLCVVHGGGDDMSAMQRALGREPAFIGGRRVTSEGDLELLRMVLSGVVNKRLVNAFLAAGVPAIGMSGEDDRLIGAEIIDAATLGFAGRAVTVNTDLLHSLFSAGYMPVISPVAYDSNNSRAGETGGGGALNVNGDDAAAAIAAALGADELFLVAGGERVRGAEGEILSTLTGESARHFIGDGVELIDSDGKRYLDFASGIAVNALGYGDAGVAGVINEALNTGLIHASNLYRTPAGEQLAAKLVERSFASKVFFCNSGAEAN